MEFAHLFTYMESRLQKRRRIALEAASAGDAGQITAGTTGHYIPVISISTPVSPLCPLPQPLSAASPSSQQYEEEEVEEEQQPRSSSPLSPTPPQQKEERQQAPSTPPSPPQQQERRRTYNEARHLGDTIGRAVRRYSKPGQERVLALARYWRRQAAELATTLGTMDTKEQDAMLLKRMDKISGMVVGVIVRCHYQRHDDSCQLVIKRLMQDADVKVDDGFAVIYSNVVERLVLYQKVTLNVETHEYNDEDFIYLYAWGRAVTYTHITFAAMDFI